MPQADGSATTTRRDKLSVLDVGGDIAKASFTAAVWPGGRRRDLGRFEHNEAGFQALSRALEPLAGGRAIHLVLEPTGGDELGMVGPAMAAGGRVSRPNPGQGRAWAKGVGIRAKTDAQAARRLAQDGAERQPAPHRPVPEAVRELERLLDRREALERRLRQERHRQGRLAGRPGVARAVAPSLERLITALEPELAAIEHASEAHLQPHPEGREPADRWQQVPGIGPKHCLPILVLLLRWEAVTDGQGSAKGLTAFADLDPQPYESGTRVHQRALISRQGQAPLRRRLFMSALGGVRGHNPLRDFYQRLVSRGKPKKVALVACARKILLWAWALVCSGEDFDPARHVASAPA